MTLNVSIDINGRKIGKLQISRIEETKDYVFKYHAKVAIQKNEYGFTRQKEFDLLHNYNEGAEKLIYLVLKEYIGESKCQ